MTARPVMAGFLRERPAPQAPSLSWLLCRNSRARSIASSTSVRAVGSAAGSRTGKIRRIRNGNRNRRMGYSRYIVSRSRARNDKSRLFLLRLLRVRNLLEIQLDNACVIVAVLRLHVLDDLGLQFT